MSFVAGVDNRIRISPDDWVVVVANDRALVLDSQPVFAFSLAISRGVEVPSPDATHYMGQWWGKPCHLIRLTIDVDTVNGSLLGLRALVGEVGHAEFSLLARAVQLAHWIDFHAFCGRCGQPTQQHTIERAMHCGKCDALFYPKIAPCVIGLVWRESQVLLARNARFKPGRYSILAGFVEPAESAEQALAREIKEEVGVEIKQPVYQHSQPWPFPSQLMLGFTAEHAEGEIQPDGIEIIEAGWFGFDKLPDIPPAETISGQLIRQFVSRCKSI